MSISPEIYQNCKAWPFQEARNLLKRLERSGNDKG